jgi:glycosyltransferase involved in cell wall biosynthesis
MKLLIITQKVNITDPVLGFFHTWIKEFSEHYESVEVICLEKGKYDLPQNVSIYSLGKEEGESKIKYIFRFYKYIWSLRNKYDRVFIHMNHVYVILGSILWRIWDKKVGLWYVHRQKSFSLWIATLLAEYIFTSTPESFLIKTRKVNYLGHGIDLNNFPSEEPLNSEIKTISYFGRITKIKNLETLIDALDILNKTDGKYEVKIIGGTVTEADKEYKKLLQDKIQKLGLTEKIQFIPPVLPSELKAFYKNSYVTVNLSPTGGMDKTVLESLASNRAVFASNLAFREVFGAYSESFLFKQNDYQNLAQKIVIFQSREDQKEIVEILSKKIRLLFDNNILINKISLILNKNI